MCYPYIWGAGIIVIYWNKNSPDLKPQGTQGQHVPCAQQSGRYLQLTCSKLHSHFLPRAVTSLLLKKKKNYSHVAL